MTKSTKSEPKIEKLCKEMLMEYFLTENIPITKSSLLIVSVNKYLHINFELLISTYGNCRYQCKNYH